MFIAKHRGAFQPKIIWVYDFPVRIQITTSDWEYLKCITLQFHILFSSPISVWDKIKEIIYAGTTFVSLYTITVETRMMIV
jgi:hypothetical protein